MDKILKNDQILKVYTRDDKIYRSSDCVVTQIIIQIMLRDKTIHTIIYGMEVDREVSWYRGTRETELFFSHSGTAYLFEPSLGFISARSKHFHFEFSNEGNVENDLRSDL